jgi:hypothetical protein
MKHIKLFEDFKSVIIAYHGSNEDFQHFNNEYLKSEKEGFNAFGEGFYFVDNEQEASNYGAYVYECELLLNNPFDIDENIDYFDSLKEKYTSEEYTNILIEQGYDSITLEKSWNRLYVVFDSRNIQLLHKKHA